MNRVSGIFFQQDVLEVAPALLGCYIVRQFDTGDVVRFRITEVEAYRGEEDKACHAHKGRTSRTEVMYHSGGKLYIYLIYGMHYMLNVVTGQAGSPEAVLIRGIEGTSGPGRVARKLAIDKSFYGETLPSARIWIEHAPDKAKVVYEVSPRIGIDYAQEWRDKPWRFVLTEKKSHR